MAKTLTPSELAAQLLSLGMEVPEALTQKIENEVEDNAVEKVAQALISDDAKLAVAWQTELFSLAPRFLSDFKTETVNKQGKGTGQVNRTQVSIETPEGTLFVRLSRDA